MILIAEIIHFRGTYSLKSKLKVLGSRKLETSDFVTAIRWFS